MTNKKHPLKILLSIALTGVFLLLAFGSEDKKEKATSSWKKDSPKSFCGKTFSNEEYQSEMGMKKHYRTVLNCEGTYTSEQDWDTDSKSTREVYEKTVGVSQGNFESFSGTWEMATGGIPDYITSHISTLEDFEPNHMAKGQTTIIRYQSNKGRSGYAYIYQSDEDGIVITPIPSATEASSSYDDDDLHLYFGKSQ